MVGEVISRGSCPPQLQLWMLDLPSVSAILMCACCLLSDCMGNPNIYDRSVFKIHYFKGQQKWWLVFTGPLFKHHIVKPRDTRWVKQIECATSPKNAKLQRIHNHWDMCRIQLIQDYFLAFSLRVYLYFCLYDNNRCPTGYLRIDMASGYPHVCTKVNLLCTICSSADQQRSLQGSLTTGLLGYNTYS